MGGGEGGLVAAVIDLLQYSSRYILDWFVPRGGALCGSHDLVVLSFSHVTYPAQVPQERGHQIHHVLAKKNGPTDCFCLSLMFWRVKGEAGLDWREWKYHQKDAG